ncbi:MAG TPA: VOC family protein [Caulobacteraceae bacterium]|nr:VOC family protein [Caulobacteraceae bacterium]
MLSQETLVAFLATSNPEAARGFYGGVLELTLLFDEEHLMVFESGASRVALQKADKVNPPHGTALGWNVKDIRGTMAALSARGVTFERYPGMQQDEQGVWSPVPGQGVAWFKDPDSNTLSLSGAIG